MHQGHDHTNPPGAPGVVVGQTFSRRSAVNELDSVYRVAATHHAWHALNERRHAFRLAWKQFFRSYDVVLCPVHASQAFAHNLEIQHESRTIQVNGHPQDYNSSLFWLAIAGLSYLPVTVRPIGVANGLPIGAQIIGPYLEDLTTLRFAELLEDICPRPVHPYERQTSQTVRASRCRKSRVIDSRIRNKETQDEWRRRIEGG